MIGIAVDHLQVPASFSQCLFGQLPDLRFLLKLVLAQLQFSYLRQRCLPALVKMLTLKLDLTQRLPGRLQGLCTGLLRQL